MKMRYFTVVSIDSKILAEINDLISVKNMHMSLLPPFFLKEGVSESELVTKIREIKFDRFEAYFSGLSEFVQREKRILHARVEPEDKCLELSERLFKAVRELIEIDVNPYTKGIVPAFQAHVTLNYNFTGNKIDLVPKLIFPVETVSLYKGADGEWIECGP